MLSQKSKYALKALGYLAKNHGSGPVLMSVIARDKKIPLAFLENIFHELKKAGFLISYRGRFGGYTLAEAPDQVKVASIIRVVNGPLAMLPCVSLNFYRSEEHTSELQSRPHLVCRLLLEKKKKKWDTEHGVRS